MRSYYQKVVVGRERQGKSSRNNLFLKKFEETGCLTRRPGSGRPSKATTEIKGNCGAPNAQGQHDYGSSTALYTGGLQIQHYLKNCSPLPHCSRVDLLWQCVLPTDSRDKQRQTPGLGASTSSWNLRQCHMDRWMYNSVRDSQAFLLPEARGATQAQTQVQYISCIIM